MKTIENLNSVRIDWNRFFEELAKEEIILNDELLSFLCKVGITKDQMVVVLKKKQLFISKENYPVVVSQLAECFKLSGAEFLEKLFEFEQYQFIAQNKDNWDFLLEKGRYQEVGKLRMAAGKYNEAIYQQFGAEALVELEDWNTLAYVCEFEILAANEKWGYLAFPKVNPEDFLAIVYEKSWELLAKAGHLDELFKWSNWQTDDNYAYFKVVYKVVSWLSCSGYASLLVEHYEKILLHPAYQSEASSVNLEVLFLLNIVWLNCEHSEDKERCVKILAQRVILEGRIDICTMWQANHELARDLYRYLRVRGIWAKKYRKSLFWAVWGEDGLGSAIKAWRYLKKTGD